MIVIHYNICCINVPDNGFASCPSVPAVSATPFAAEWLVPFRFSKDFLKDAMVPVSAPTAPMYSSEQAGGRSGCLIPSG